MSHVLTLIAAPGALDTALVSRIVNAVGCRRSMTLSEGEAIDIPCNRPLPDIRDIRAIIGNEPVDAVMALAQNRRKRLLIADMDSTIVTGETLDELAAFAGVGERVVAITKRSMNGELDFATALRERVALLEGLPISALDETWKGVHLTPGARTLVKTMRANGATTALVSGGFTWFTSRVAALCGFDTHRANTLLDNGTTLTGRVADPILDREAKLATLNELAAAHTLTLDDCLAVGDGANDLAMIRAAGLGVAYHAKPVVAAEARAQVRHTDLRALLFMQGYTAAEFIH